MKEEGIQPQDDGSCHHKSRVSLLVINVQPMCLNQLPKLFNAHWHKNIGRH